MVANFTPPDTPNEPQPIGAVLLDVATLLATPVERHPVIRTSQTEAREPVPRALVLHRDGYRCVICGNSGALEVDHIIPWSAGGSDEIDNLRTLCQRCNQERSNFRIPADDLPRLPIGHQCIYCYPELLEIDNDDLVPVHCLCSRKAPGLVR